MRIMLLCTALLALSAAATPAAAQTGGQQIEQACVSSFVTEGSFLSGRNFRAAAVADGVSTADAVQRVAQALALQGRWRNIDGNRELGTVSALLGVGGNDQAVTSLNIVIQDAPQGARMNAVFSARGGLMVRLEPLRDMICGALAGAAS